MIRMSEEVDNYQKKQIIAELPTWKFKNYESSKHKKPNVLWVFGP